MEFSVSTLTIIFMAVSALISIGLPVAFFVYIFRKHKAKFLPMLAGIAGFVIFALVLESLLHMVVFGNFPVLTEKPFLYILYGIFAAGIFEETARFISFSILKKKFKGVVTGLSYGIGHGGIEAIIIVGIAMINGIISSIVYNAGNLESLTANLDPEQLVQLYNQLGSFIVSPSYLFIIGGIERIFAMSIHLSLSVVVFYSVYSKDKLWLYPAAILLHAIINIPAAAYQIGVLNNIFVIEGLTLIGAALTVLAALFVHSKLKENPVIPAENVQIASLQQE